MKEGDDPIVPHVQHIPEAVQAPVRTREQPAVPMGTTGPQPRHAAKRISVNRLLVYIFLFIAILAMLYVNIRSVPR